MEELLIIERKIIGHKKAIEDSKGKHCFKLKIKLWWYKRRFNKLKNKLYNKKGGNKWTI